MVRRWRALRGLSNAQDLAVCEVRKSSAVKAGAPEVHSGWTWRRPRRVLNVEHRRLGSLAWEMILSSQYARSFSRLDLSAVDRTSKGDRWCSGWGVGLPIERHGVRILGLPSNLLDYSLLSIYIVPLSSQSERLQKNNIRLANHIHMLRL